MPPKHKDSNYNIDDQRRIYESATLNNEQQRSFDRIVQAVTDPSSVPTNLFFLQAPAGCGKTFLYNHIAAYLRSKQKLVVCVASSGAASLLLPGGTTAHRRFSIPLTASDPGVIATCGITAQSKLAQLICETDLIVWDEATLQHRQVFETLDRTMRDFIKIDKPFGGVVCLFGGDWAQCLPVISSGQPLRPATVEATLKSSYLWESIETLSLQRNMRLRVQDNDFTQFLLSLSRDPQFSNTQVTLPPYIRKFHDRDRFINSLITQQWLNLPDPSTAILAFHNSTVDEINEYVYEKLNTFEKIFLSSDELFDNDTANEHTPSLLLGPEATRNLQINNLPPGILKLKINSVVMLLRNLDPSVGLCNGTRMVVQSFGTTSVHCRIIGNQFHDTIHCIPRITLEASYKGLRIKRKQIPLTLCYAMTVHKSQGQTLSKVGIDLYQSPFTHGLLYVALSRTTSANGVSLLLRRGTTTVQNIVYTELIEPL